MHRCLHTARAPMATATQVISSPVHAHISCLCKHRRGGCLLDKNAENCPRGISLYLLQARQGIMTCKMLHSGSLLLLDLHADLIAIFLRENLGVQDHSLHCCRIARPLQRWLRTPPRTPWRSSLKILPTVLPSAPSG